MNTLDQTLSEVAALTRTMARFVHAEGDFSLGRALDEIAEGAERASQSEQAGEGRIEIADAYRALYAPKEGGLANFYRQHPDANHQLELNVEMQRVQDQLNALLNICR